MMNQGAKQSVNSRRTYSVYVLFVILAFFYCYALVQIFIKDQVHIWEQDGVVIFVIIGLLILYCIALFAILKVAIHNKSKDEIIHPFKPVTNQPLSGEGNCLFAVLQEIDLLLKDNATVNEKISKLVIPVPKNLSNENMTPFVDYIIDLSELPYSISKLTDEPINQSETITSPIEQFIYSICQRTHFDSFTSNLISAMGKLADAKSIIAENIRDDLVRYGQDMNYFFHHVGETEGWTRILEGTANQLEHSTTSVFTVARGYIKKTAKEGGKFVAQTAGLDGVKGFLSSFIDDETWQHLHSIEDLTISAAKELAEGLMPTIDLDLWQPDFDLGGHFPILKVGIEGLNLIKKSEQDDVNVMKALQNSATRVGGSWGGATLGLAIGTLLCPGVGTVIGPMIGGWLGNFSANRVIVNSVKEKQERLNRWIEELRILGSQAQKIIEICQNKTADIITKTSIEQASIFNELKENGPVDEDEVYSIYISIGIMLKDYLESFIQRLWFIDKESYLKEKPKLESFVPTIGQLRMYPEDSIKLLLSAQTYIQDNFVEDQYFNYSLSINTTMESATRYLILLKYLEVIWLTDIYNTYSKGVNELLTVSNTQFGELQKVCLTEKEKVDNKRKDCERLAKNIKESLNAI